jgi:ADP-ribose pyrophosphatase
MLTGPAGTAEATMTSTTDIAAGPAVRTVRFGLDGADYEVTLSADREQHLRATLAPYLGAARRHRPARARRRKPGRPAGRTYTHPSVILAGVAEGWAEAETDPARIDWPARQARAAIPFQVIGGRPVNPCQRTGIAHGRNEMGWWGETRMADALVTVTCDGARYLLMIERHDGHGWAVPGGHAEPGETGTLAAFRELAEETGLAVDYSAAWRVLPPRYVPDPRASDEAWAVTIPVTIDLGQAGELPALTAADDARRAVWIPAATYSQLAGVLHRDYGGQVFAAHTAMLRHHLDGEAP